MLQCILLTVTCSFLTVIYFSKYMLHRALLNKQQSIPKNLHTFLLLGKVGCISKNNPGYTFRANGFMLEFLLGFENVFCLWVYRITLAWINDCKDHGKLILPFSVSLRMGTLLLTQCGSFSSKWTPTFLIFGLPIQDFMYSQFGPNICYVEPSVRLKSDLVAL